MRKFGLIGFPLQHSFSQSYFTEKFTREKLNNCVYKTFPLEHIESFQTLLTDNPELNGLNVTIPHKTSIIPFLKELDTTAKVIGAVNTIKIYLTGHTKGFNTDAWGFIKSVVPLIKSSACKALILGSGGASKAVTFVLDKLGVKYTIVSRHKSSTHLTYEELTEKHIQDHLLIINCTPLGTFPSVDTYPNIPYEGIGSHHTLYDLVYNPEETEFLKRGKARGASIKNGYEMLINQAEESWKIWNDPES